MSQKMSQKVSSYKELKFWELAKQVSLLVFRLIKKITK